MQFSVKKTFIKYYLDTNFTSDEGLLYLSIMATTFSSQEIALTLPVFVTFCPEFPPPPKTPKHKPFIPPNGLTTRRQN